MGYVISGMYFGWNLGLEKGGTLGMALATLVIMYMTFTFSFTELACAIPKAGGVFDYAGSVLGKDIAFISGIAQTVEFVFDRTIQHSHHHPVWLWGRGRTPCLPRAA